MQGSLRKGEVFLSDKEKEYLKIPFYFWAQETLKEPDPTRIDTYRKPNKEVKVEKMSLFPSQELIKGMKEANEIAYLDYNIGTIRMDPEEISFKLTSYIHEGTEFVVERKRGKVNMGDIV